MDKELRLIYPFKYIPDIKEIEVDKSVLEYYL